MPKCEQLSTEEVVMQTRSSIHYLNGLLETGMPVDSRFQRDQKAIRLVSIHQFDLPRDEQRQATEILSNLFRNNLLRGNHLNEFVGRHAYLVWTEVLGKP